MTLRSITYVVKDYFTFSKRHRRYAFVLTLLLLALLAWQAYCRFMVPPPEGRFTGFAQEFHAFEAQHAAASPRREAMAAPARKPSRPAPAPVVVLQPFDPNRTPDSVWRSLGVPARLVRRIRHYLEAGGRFRQTGDLAKIYGFPHADFERLAPYVRIPAHAAVAAKYRDTAATVFDLNTVTAKELESLRGIGPVRARAIVDYRSALGGFVSKDQLLESYGIDSALFDSLRRRVAVTAAPWRRIDINDDGLAGKRHPYLTRRFARLVGSYRRQHGDYVSPEDLKRIRALDSTVLKRIFPYLTAR